MKQRREAGRNARCINVEVMDDPHFSKCRIVKIIGGFSRHIGKPEPIPEANFVENACGTSKTAMSLTITI